MAPLLASGSATAADTGSRRFAVSMQQGLSSHVAGVCVTAGGPDLRSVTVDLAPTHGRVGRRHWKHPRRQGRRQELRELLDRAVSHRGPHYSERVTPCEDGLPLNPPGKAFKDVVL
ncbi:hypothetical protein [Corallococcus carmarthensis]|uniref:Uncharacterized protein n=1 Tax=Corallococcus carmarthensis TaxID=2316728 RepID=A0A3A8K1U6_9BACT|nr:hypothetical protein [Corallococcus carmarthensis]NOK16333.1 hypothetical protein [Corallococcus carmarthensis]RKH01237.1 hypothetical protein D7X32_21030 [Corallococcus carmarthensis]